MTVSSNDPSWWPLINVSLIFSYFIVAASAGVMYDWALTFGQEVELIWRQRWSLMTVLYLIVRYVGIGYAVLFFFLVTGRHIVSIPTFSTTDAGCSIMYDALTWTSNVVNVMLGVIMIARLHAMYQQSRKVLIFLIVIFLATGITNAVIAAIIVRHISWEEFILSGTYQCMTSYAVGDVPLLYFMTWTITTVWELLALCLAAWITVKHIRELRQHSASDIIGDCFTMLMKNHAGYFASSFGYSAMLSNQYSLGSQIDLGLSYIVQFTQLFVLGPRLILSVREYHAKLVANSDTATAMASIAFQERIHVSTSSSV
ncbi:hypothetical protein EV702DRAFT_1049162 [Suillus placidus]|uniref:DUF6533 domain-containing protein n=1 Tax=Suillus placidus TaxID=48579 RepID=A0A9P7CY86_9AGAM|nr:hypothetical protein EV702DRAFT_1049162 [Suillus placidus]